MLLKEHARTGNGNQHFELRRRIIQNNQLALNDVSQNLYSHSISNCIVLGRMYVKVEGFRKIYVMTCTQQEVNFSQFYILEPRGGCV